MDLKKFFTKSLLQFIQISKKVPKIYVDNALALFPVILDSYFMYEAYTLENAPP
ncbi:hypothetical protein Cs308_0049 [Candidatus Chlamydia sanziniae]|uniref:Uncharacterized protein n=1 Tax=Candidatus Chlamydia sanziniae TaxID=1806891 RepID=A0A1A9HTQ9_9CHLA|nr:hypothetical protein Cs308_0049 [Candidatus Chlamydia sanziniae]